jgi:hypothetical protein
MSIVRSVFSSIFEPVFRKVTEPSSGSGVINLTESAWEALEEYDLDATYKVAGVGTYEGVTLVEPETWAPVAGDLYVAKTGSDANPGTVAGSPKLTIWSALNSVSTSNATPITIWVDAGTYDENASGGYLLFTKSFTNMVTVRGKPGVLPIVRNVSGSYLLRPNSVNNVRFRNLEFQSSSATLGFLFTNQPLSNFEVIECVFTDANSRATCVSLANATQSNIAIKRCTFSSAAAFNTAITTATGTKVIGNTYSQSVANNITVSGTAVVSSNVGLKTIIAINGRTSVAATQVTANGNTIQNVTHSSGAVGFESVLNFSRNIIDAPSTVRGLAIIGYTAGGGAWDNTITSLGDTGLGWPIDGGTSVCTGHEIDGNTITNNGTSGHAILLSTGSSQAIVSNNTTDASGGGAYGLVLKGTQHTVEYNTFNGGNLNGMLLKDVDDSVIVFNTINSTKGTAIALEFDDGSANNTVRDNTFNITAGTLYTQLLADIGADNQVNSNTYALSGTATWGSLLGATVSSLADVRARWTSQYASMPSNDSTSTSI